MKNKPLWQNYTKNDVTNWRNYSRALLKHVVHLENKIQCLKVELHKRAETKTPKEESWDNGNSNPFNGTDFGSLFDDIFKK